MSDRLSPVIMPTKYERPDREESNVVEAVAYGGWDFNRDNVTEDDLVSQIDDELMMYFTQNGTVYVGVGHCHVAESLYRSNPVVFLREKCLDVVVKLEDAGVIEGLEVVNRRKIRGVGK